jgi:pimeloyl-ACP methyl ester carboxylesterase
MLPGLDGTGIMFRPIVDELGSEVDPIVMSYNQEGTCTYNALTDLVADSLPQNDFFILGESFSGPIAIKLADRKPKGLKGIILCATFISNPSALIPAFFSFLIRAPLFYIWPVSVKAAVLTGGRANRQIRGLIEETKRVSTSKALACRTRQALQVNVSSELERCDYPILYLKGARDLIVGSRNLRAIKKIKENVSDVTIDSSHLVLQEAPRDAAQEILKFIRTAT